MISQLSALNFSVCFSSLSMSVFFFLSLFFWLFFFCLLLFYLFFLYDFFLLSSSLLSFIFFIFSIFFFFFSFLLFFVFFLFSFFTEPHFSFFFRNRFLIPCFLTAGQGPLFFVRFFRQNVRKNAQTLTTKWRKKWGQKKRKTVFYLY